LPVVGGNVSLYNESGGADIDPTPVVGIFGVIDKLDKAPAEAGLTDGAAIVLIGHTQAVLGGSRWAVESRGHRGGMLPSLDLETHARLLGLVVGLIGEGVVEGIHDVSDGGLALALAEMAIRSGVGFRISGPADPAELFCESPSRVVVCSRGPEQVASKSADAGLPAKVLGMAGGDRLWVEGLVDLSLADAGAAWRDDIPRRMDVSA
ncbi:MAG: AIR synthase-related protein, partial [Acidimicrobiales bacterium]